MGRKYIKYVTDEKLSQVNPKNRHLIDRYFSFKNMNLSPTTKKSYLSDFNQWLVFILDRYENGYILDIINHDVDDMVDLIEDYIAFATSVLGNNERRVQRRMSSISSFFLFLRKKRKIRENPIDYLERPSVRAGEKLQVKQTFLTKEQVSQIRKGLKEIGDIQLSLFFEFGLSTMARANAISNVKIEQIDFDKQIVQDVLEKEGKLVKLFPSTRAFELINQWLQYRKDHKIKNEYLFLVNHGTQWLKAQKSVLQGKWIKKIGNIINVDLHCHDLRHSGSNLLYHGGMKLEDVSRLLSHSGTEVTRQHYLQEDENEIQENKRKFEI